MAAPDDVAHAMISYIRENRTEVERLHGLLEKAGVPVWRDLKKLKPGVDWKQEIRTAIRSDAFAFLPCFSRELSEREKSVMWEELTIAVEEFRQRAPGKAWMFPVRLDDTPLPYVNLGGGRTLETLQYVDLFGESYTEAMIELVTAVRAAMGLDSSPTADVTQAVVNEASTERRPALLRETTKKLLLDATHRIQLDDLITGEARRVVRIVDDAKTIEYTGPTENSAMSIAAAEVARHLWREVEPFCWSLQVAVRYTDDVAQLKPWAAALQAMAARATVPRNGYEMLTATRFIPALAATFTGSLAAVSQGNWAALKALTVDATVHAPYQEGSAQPVIELVTPWAPFSSMGDDVQQLLAYGETKGEDFATVAATLRKPGGRGGLLTPTADWLHAVLRPIFEEQFVDEDSYDRAFDRTEIMLGMVSQHVAGQRAARHPDHAWRNHSSWFGRSTWRSRHHLSSALPDVAAELDAEQDAWAPLRVGLFNGSRDDAEAALTAYAKDFQERRSRQL